MVGSVLWRVVEGEEGGVGRVEWIQCLAAGRSPILRRRRTSHVVSIFCSVAASTVWVFVWGLDIGRVGVMVVVEAW